MVLVGAGDMGVMVSRPSEDGRRSGGGERPPLWTRNRKRSTDWTSPRLTNESRSVSEKKVSEMVRHER